MNWALAKHRRDSLLSKVTKILDSLPDGAVAFSGLAGLNQFHVMGLAATEQLAQIASIERGGPSRYLASTYGDKRRRKVRADNATAVGAER